MSDGNMLDGNIPAPTPAPTPTPVLTPIVETPPATFKKQLEKEPAIKDDDVVSLTKSQLKDRLKRTEENALKNFMIDKENLNSQIKEKENLLLEKDKIILEYEQKQSINKLENNLFKAGITDEAYLFYACQKFQTEVKSNPELKVEDWISEYKTKQPNWFNGVKIESFGGVPPHDPNLNKTTEDKLSERFEKIIKKGSPNFQY